MAKGDQIVVPEFTKLETPLADESAGPRLLLEHELNVTVAAIVDLEKKLRASKVHERQLRARLGSLAR